VVLWVGLKKSGPASTLLKNDEETSTLNEPDTIYVYGVFSGDSSEAYSAFLGVATTSDDFKFAHTFGSDQESITLLPKKLKYEGDLKDKEEVRKWIESEAFPSLTELDQKVWKRSVMSKQSLFVGFIHPDTEEKHAEEKKEIQEIADQYKGKFFVSWMDGVKNEGLVSRWGGTGKVVPTSIFVHFPEGATDPKFHIWNEDTEKEFNYAALKNFIELSLAGKYPGFKKSEPIPESNDGPVKVVVGKNFNEIVLDNTKDVLLEFYAPWCGHCQKLAPTYEELGTYFKDSHKNVVIAKIDATANSYPDSIAIRGFPTIMLFSANNKENPVSYEGERTLEDLKKFMESNINPSDEKVDL